MPQALICVQCGHEWADPLNQLSREERDDIRNCIGCPECSTPESRASKEKDMYGISTPRRVGRPKERAVPVVQVHLMLDAALVEKIDGLLMRDESRRAFIEDWLKKHPRLQE